MQVILSVRFHIGIILEKYILPNFLSSRVLKEKYKDWLQKRARSHVRRDRERGNKTASVAEYQGAIHQAVIESKGEDFYTGEPLDWELIGTYDNEASKRSGRVYKREYGMLPSVDHVHDGLGPADFKICSWKMNDAKNDLSYDEFLELCKKVIEHRNNIKI